MFPVSNLFKLSVMCVVMVIVTGPTQTYALPRAHSERSSGHDRQPSGGVAPETIPLHLDSDYLVPSRPQRDLSNHSISPWSYNTSLDMDRIPHVLMEARCSLRGCLDVDGVEDLSLESKPIWNQMLVLRRVLGPGARAYQYRLESRLVSVGCTCVRPSVLQQDH